MRKKVFCFTVDVDYVKGSEVGVTGLLDLCNRLSISATFFITGKFANEYPNIVKNIVDEGHSIGMHGWDHGEDPDEDFASTDYQYLDERVRLATRAIEDACGVKPKMFRAPNLWMGETALKVLEDHGYEIDSSIPARRLLGRIRNYKYLWAPLKAYKPSLKNANYIGKSKLIEIPPAAFFLPINMSSLRMFRVFGLRPFVALLYLRTPILNFYVHPAEFVIANDLEYSYPIPERHLKGIGPQNYQLVEDFILMLTQKKIKVVTLNEVEVE